MDWYTVVLILLFFVLPLIQQVREQARRKQRPPPLPPDQRVPEHEPESSSERKAESGSGSLPEGISGRTGGWSEGWAPWPTEGEIETEPLPTTVESAPRRIEWDSLPSPTRYEPSVPEPVQPRKIAIRVARPVEAEKAPPTRAEPRGPGAAPKVRVRGRPPIARFLDRPHDLQRALVLREVLGPPAALRLDDTDLPH